MYAEHSKDNQIRLTILFVIAMLHGCGAAHVRTDMESTDLHQYDDVFISTVRVHSEEDGANQNEELQAEMREWSVFARGVLEGYVNDSHYQLLSQPPASTDKALILNVDIEMTYGNRALRYWAGFGAGKGSVDSVLTATDNLTEASKFQAVANSDLSMGAFGGDMEAVLMKNVEALVDQYPRVPEGDL